MFIRAMALIIIAPISLLGSAGQARADIFASHAEPLLPTISWVSWAAGNDTQTLLTSPSVGITAAVSCTTAGVQCSNTSLLSLQSDYPNVIEVNLLEDDWADGDGLLSR